MTASTSRPASAGRIAAAPLIINLAPTGLVPRKADSVHVPLQPGEIIADVLRAAERGITIVHLHARDADGQPTHSKDVYARIISGIRDHRPDLILCVSCSGRTVSDPALRAEVLELDGDLKPDMASLTLSSLNFARNVSINEPDTVKYLAQRMLDAGIRPELEVFDLGMANMISYLLSRSFLKTPLYANLLFGNVAAAQAGFLEVGALIAGLPQGTWWSMGGIGSAQMPIAAMAAAGAPGVRIGLEDHLWLDARRETLASNTALVERVHQMRQLLGRDLMTPSALRAVLDLPSY